MAVSKRPLTPEPNGKTAKKTVLPTKQSDFSEHEKEDVEAWAEVLAKSITVRQLEQKKIRDDEGDNFDARYRDDEEFRKAWDNHEDRIDREEAAYEVAAEWLRKD